MATGRPKGISARKVLDFIAAAPDAPKASDDGTEKAAIKRRKKNADRQDAGLENGAPSAGRKAGATSAQAYDTWPYNVVGKKTSTLALTLPTALLDRLEAAAGQQGLALDAFAAQLLERGLGRK